MTEGTIRQSLAPGLQSALELLSKSWLILLAAIYGSGYVVVSVYYASLGLGQINPLRPKIAAAGLLLCVLVCVAVFFGHVVVTILSEPLRNSLLGMVGLCCADYIGANAVALMMHCMRPGKAILPLGVGG